MESARDQLHAEGTQWHSQPCKQDMADAASEPEVASIQLVVTEVKDAIAKQLAGFMMIGARDMNEAIEVAAKHPLARPGTIEVRPIR